jgi:hypothetical protein
MKICILSVVVVLAATACGSAEKPRAAGGVDASGVASCLSGKEFVVRSQAKSITGSSPGGAVFALTFYRSDAAAKAARANQPAATTAVVENAVVDFSHNPRPSTSSPPLKLTAKDLATLRACIADNG